MRESEIRERRFEKSFKGYDADEVESFLVEVANDFRKLNDDNETLKKKLEVLKNEVRKYRNDEDALKDALLGAQKQGNKVVAEAKEKAEKLVNDANEKKDTILAKLASDKEQLIQENETLEREAKETAQELISTAREKAKQISDDLKVQNDIQRELLYQTETEVNEFREKIIAALKRVSDDIIEMPEKYKNDYIKKTLFEHKAGGETLKKTKAEAAPRTVSEPPVAKAPKAEPDKPEVVKTETNEPETDNSEIDKTKTFKSVSRNETENDSETDSGEFRLEKGLAEIFGAKPEKQKLSSTSSIEIDSDGENEKESKGFGFFLKKNSAENFSDDTEAIKAKKAFPYNLITKS
ncbi:MAG: DivIVA domain-containing protein [Oscillospiraceae bacterium]|nr:DivIVA domain-containing protein [Oscillospiraceae bacterium]